MSADWAGAVMPLLPATPAVLGATVGLFAYRRLVAERRRAAPYSGPVWAADRGQSAIGHRWATSGGGSETTLPRAGSGSAVRSHRRVKARRQPGRIRALMGGLWLWVWPPAEAPAAEPVPPVPQPTARHSIDSPTRAMPVNAGYRAAGRVPMKPPPPWRPKTRTEVTETVVEDFAEAGIPTDTLDAALAMVPSLQAWNHDPDRTDLTPAVPAGPDDRQMVDADDRWPR